jgi:hypothetical protein
MKDIMIWHCYHYARHDTFVLVAETQEALEAKVRQAAIDDWDDDFADDDDGPMPDVLLRRVRWRNTRSYTEGTCYFGDWGYTIIDSTLCQPVGEE